MDGHHGVEGVVIPPAGWQDVGQVLDDPPLTFEEAAVLPTMGTCRGCGRYANVLNTDGTIPAHQRHATAGEVERDQARGQSYLRRCDGAGLSPAEASDTA